MEVKSSMEHCNESDTVPLSVISLMMYCNPEVELMAKEELEGTVTQLEKNLTREDIHTQDAIRTWGLLSDCYSQLNWERKAMCAALNQLQYNQPRTDSCCRIGHLHFNKKNWLSATVWYKLAIEVSLTEAIRIDEPNQTWLPHLQLCVCYDKLGEYQKAYKHHIIAQNYVPEHPSILSNKTYFDKLFMNPNLVKFPDCQLSILIPSVPERMPFLNKLLPELNRQTLHKPVEILVHIDNKKSVIAHKRNNLLSQAKGRFISFIDDDDRISPNYIDTLLATIEQVPHADCIVFDVEVTINGGPPKLAKYDKDYTFGEDENYYYRKPNHLMCYAKKIASRHLFKETLIAGEDDIWGGEASADIHVQHRINETLYFYDGIVKPENWYNPVM